MFFLMEVHFSPFCPLLGPLTNRILLAHDWSNNFEVEKNLKNEHSIQRFDWISKITKAEKLKKRNAEFITM